MADADEIVRESIYSALERRRHLRHRVLEYGVALPDEDLLDRHKALRVVVALGYPTPQVVGRWPPKEKPPPSTEYPNRFSVYPCSTLTASQGETLVRCGDGYRRELTGDELKLGDLLEQLDQEQGSSGLVLTEDVSRSSCWWVTGIGFSGAVAMVSWRHRDGRRGFLQASDTRGLENRTPTGLPGDIGGEAVQVIAAISAAIQIPMVEVDLAGVGRELLVTRLTPELPARALDARAQELLASCWHASEARLAARLSAHGAYDTAL